MTTHESIRYVASVTLELTAPLSIGSGRAAGIEDIQLIRDANGLPVIPGSSLAGVLRASMRAAGMDASCERALFGFAEGDRGQRSRVTVSWAHIHDCNGRVMQGLHSAMSLQRDPILAPLLTSATLQRQHVRLDHRGTASDTGLFNRSYVPVGHRFTFRLQLEADEAGDGDSWAKLLRTLRSKAFRLGGATRRGYGGVKVHALCARQFDLRNPAELDAYVRLGVRLDPNPILPEVDQRELESPAADDAWLSMSLHLEPVGAWRVGAGQRSLDRRKRAHSVDATPYVEPYVDWRNGGASLADAVVVPASAIKGALAHRIAYHLQCIEGIFAEDQADPHGDWDAREALPSLRPLLGHVGESKPTSAKSDGVDASRAQLMIDDARIPLASIGESDVWTLTHTSADRFTGGARDGLLFTEQMILGRSISTRIAVPRSFAAPANVKRALYRALTDLAEARLPLGAASARGYGFVKAQLDSTHPFMLWLNPAADARASDPITHQGGAI